MSPRRCCLAVLLCAAGAVPLRAEPVAVTVNAGARLTYDSNLFRLSRLERDASGFRSIDDVVVVPQVAGQVRVPLGLQELVAAGRIAHRSHRSNDELDATETGLAARLRYVLPFSCTGLLGLRQFRQQTDYDDVLDEQRRQVLVRERAFDGSGSCSVTPDIKASNEVSISARDNRDPVLAQYDLREQTARGEIAVGLTDTAQPFVALRYRHREQPEFVSFETPDGVRANIVDAGVGLRWTPTPYFKLDTAANLTRLRDTGGRRNNTLFTGGTVVNWEPTGKTRLRLEATRSLDVVSSIGAIAIAATTLSARATWEPTPLVTATLDARWRERELLRDLVLEGVRLSRQERDRTFGLDARLAYRLADQLEVRVGVGYRNRDANFEDREFKATIATFGISYRFSGPELDLALE